MAQPVRKPKTKSYGRPRAGGIRATKVSRANPGSKRAGRARRQDTSRFH